MRDSCLDRIDEEVEVVARAVKAEDVEAVVAATLLTSTCGRGLFLGSEIDSQAESLEWQELDSREESLRDSLGLAP